MKRSEKALKNSSISFLSQISSLLITLVTRRFFLKYLGVGLLGLSSTFVSVLNTLSLAELGFETAIVFNLFQPLSDRNYKKISSIISVFKVVYQFVAGFIIVASLVCLPFLKKILNGIEITPVVYAYFLLQTANSVASYVLAYKRTLIYADQREYLCQIIDLICNIVFSILRIISIIEFRSFSIYLFLQIIQTIISNILIHVKCKELYPEITYSGFDKEVFKEIFNNVKHVIGSKIAFFINNSTDNLVVSTFIGTVQVGYFTNYTTITSSIKRVVISLFRPVSPIIGNLLIDNEVDSKRRESALLLYTHVGYVLALVVLIPTAILLNDFIGFVYGKQFILKNIVVLLIVIDLYINFVHRACCDYINGGGLFKYDKYIEFICAFINIAVSVFLAKVCGIVGVLIGTVFSGIFFWVGRSFVVYKYCINANKRGYLKFWLKNIYGVIVFFITYIICKYTYVKFVVNNAFIVKFVFGGVLCELIIIFIYLLSYASSAERKELFSMLKSVLSKILHRKQKT